MMMWWDKNSLDRNLFQNSMTPLQLFECLICRLLFAFTGSLAFEDTTGAPDICSLNSNDIASDEGHMTVVFA